MAENEYDQSIEYGFRRQRRNLQLICFGLILFYYAGFKLTSVTIGGARAEVERPDRLLQLAWITYGMFLWRYYVFFRDYAALRTDWQDRRDRRIAKHLQRFWYKNRKPPPPDEVVTLHFGEQVGQKGTWAVMATTKTSGPSGVPIENDHDLSVVNVWWKRWITFRADAWLCFNSHSFTEVVVPFLLALAVAILGISSSK